MSNQEKALQLEAECEALCDEIAACEDLAVAKSKAASIKTKLLRLRALIAEME